MLINTTSQVIRAKIEAGATTTNPTFSTTFADITSTTFVASESTGVLTGATPVNVVASPAASTARHVKEIQIFNADSVDHIVTVDLFDGASSFVFGAFPVPAGSFLRYGPETGWQVGVTQGAGTVTSIATGTGLTGGPITGSGTISFDTVPDGSILANISGGIAPPIPNNLSDILDFELTNTQGSLIYRGASGWTVLAPGTAGFLLQTGGPAANPSWITAPATGVTSVGLALPAEFNVSGSPITSSGTFTAAWANETANFVFAGPTTGSPGTPGFRALVAADLPGGFAGFANPTASVGLTAVNGAAATAMRSDAAPALDQGIVPTWTGQHVWSVGLSAPLGSISLPSYAFTGHLDSGLFYDSTNLGIGVSWAAAQIGFFGKTASGTVSLQFFGDSTCNNSIATYNAAAATAATYTLRRSRGTQAAPALNVAGDQLGRISWQPITNTAANTFNNSMQLRGILTETATVDSTHIGTKLQLAACKIGSGTLATILEVDPNLGIINTVDDAGTNTILDQLSIIHTTTGTAAAGFGAAWIVTLENASGTSRLAGRAGVRWVTATNAAEDSEWVFSTIQGGTVAEKVRITPRGYVVSPGNTRVTADFTSITTTLANVTGLSVSVAAGKTYHFRAWLPYTADATSGHKYAIAGTATATDIRYTIGAVDGTSGLYVIPPAQQTALAASAGQAGSTAGQTEIEGTITVNATGILTVQFGLNAGTTTGTIKRGATFIVTEID